MGLTKTVKSYAARPGCPRSPGAAALCAPSPSHVVVGPRNFAIPRTGYPSRSGDRSLVRVIRLRGRYAVGVEDRVDVPQRDQQAAERLDVPDLGDVPVLRQLILDDAAVRDDVRAVLRERPRDVLEQSRAVPRVDCDVDAERGAVAVGPLHLREALR